MYVCNLAMYYILCIYGLLSEINSYILYIRQTGLMFSAVIRQTGLMFSAVIRQTGLMFSAVIRQTGLMFSAVIRQTFFCNSCSFMNSVFSH